MQPYAANDSEGNVDATEETGVEWRRLVSAAPLTLEPLGDTGLVTEPEPTPVFRSFPWIQLVFCLACLSMAAWTWMRYSYAWHVTPSDIRIVVEAGSVEPRWRGSPPGIYHDWQRLGGRYVTFTCEAGRIAFPLALRFPDDMWVAVVTDPNAALPADDEMVTVTGRVAEDNHCVYPAHSRFTDASVAGLVIGAMGCFIFGLYLRRWLIDRKALASEPQQDMIA